MMDKFRNVLEKHKYAISIFVFFLVYNFVVVGNFSFPTIDKFCYSFYLVDYSVGFCPGLLPGAIYNALFSTTQQGIVNFYVNILYHLFLLAVSFMLEKFLYKFDSKNRIIAFIIVLFFITGPLTFSFHVIEIGMLDTYWVFFAIALLIIIQNKYLKWFVPIIFVLSVFIHVGALISFIPFFALIVLLEASRNEKVSKSYMLIFSVSVLLAAATFIYFTAFEESNLFLSLNSFKKLISERNISEWEDWPDYFSYALYRTIPDGYNIQMENFALDGSDNILAQVFGVVLRQIKFTFGFFTETYGKSYANFVSATFISIPVIVLLYKFVLSFFKKENKLRRFVWFCALCLLPFTFVNSLLLSVDLSKWLGNGVICLFTLVMYELYRSSDADRLEPLNKSLNPSSYFAVIIYFVFYMTCIVNPFT